MFFQERFINFATDIYAMHINENIWALECDPGVNSYLYIYIQSNNKKTTTAIIYTHFVNPRECRLV